MPLSHTKYSRLTLNGTPMEREQLLQMAGSVKEHPEPPKWESALFGFIREWLHPSEYLKVTTSGSTGRPKTIEISKSAMLKSAFNTLDFFGLSPGKHALLCLSCEYIAGKMMVVRAFAGDLDLVTVPVSGRPLKNLTRPVDFAALTPLQMSQELQQQSDHLQFLKNVILGGSPTGPELSSALQDQPFAAWETYGMTETLSHIALRRINGPSASPYFKPLKDVRLSTDERGCLVVDLPGVTRGPVVTNDIAELNEDGRFRIKGRSDNIINTGGIKVVPEEIERQISHFFKKPFFVSSLPHPVLGRELVLITEEFPTGEKELLEKIKKIVPPYHAPKQIIVKESLPRTETGKIIRRPEE